MSKKIKVSDLVDLALDGNLEKIDVRFLSNIQEAIFDGDELMEVVYPDLLVFKVDAKSYLIMDTLFHYLAMWDTYCNENTVEDFCLCSHGDISHINWSEVIRVRNEVWEEYRDKDWQMNKWESVDEDSVISV